MNNTPFQIGDKVVNIGFSGDKRTTSINDEDFYDKYIILGFFPEINKVYVIEAVGLNNGKGVALIGSTVLHKPTRLETGWHYKCFRKLEEVQAENRAKNINHEKSTI